MDYLAEHHPDEYDDILAHYSSGVGDLVGDEDEPPTPRPERPEGALMAKLGARGRTALEKIKREPIRDFLAEKFVECYRANFDPTTLTAEIQRLETEHDTLRVKCLNLKDQRAIDKTNADLSALSERSKQLEDQRDFAAESVLQHYREMWDLRQAVDEAKEAMQSTTGERALRLRKQKLRGIIQRIECHFEPTGAFRGGYGQRMARPIGVKFFPVGTGDPVYFPIPAESALQATRATSHM
jgi:hypothetical protein